MFIFETGSDPGIKQTKCPRGADKVPRLYF